ncbi:MarR family transcriptional regulator [Streptomyces gilvifuscus]|uniref:MarR family transcriptional regulator n=1 Tax=Streptomyces gilvifuscus TaxID=1550617 RepID=A0ABT5FLI1_9ACTN|nr:MarR family transcriptional regulator [Streptomyces gilvifuscus]MDC2953360.1 MarR family transcriptional regulator [Streptomyces gilvifuscus]
MTRLNAEPVGAEEMLPVLTDPNLGHGAKAVWAFLRIAADPQSQKAISEALHMNPSTVSRLVRALEAKRLIRKVNGVWVPETER